MRVPAVRRVRLAVAARRARHWPPALVLLYHRVAEPAVDPLLLSVAPSRFAEHLAVLRELCRPVPLARVAALAAAGSPKPVGGEAGRPLVAVTFDDGYADNLLAAAPLLEGAGVPATVFVVTGRLNCGTGFWWDELASLLLEADRLPASVEVSVGRRRVRLDLDESADRTAGVRDCWSIAERMDPTPRHAAYRELYRRLRPLGDADRCATIEALSLAVGREPAASAPILDAAQVAALAGLEGIEVGAHTVTHPHLPSFGAAEQRAEISGSRDALAALGIEARSFAYPFGGVGDIGRSAVRATRETGYARACANVAGGVWPGADPFRLPRLLVRDWTGVELAERLVRWIRDPLA